MGVPAFNLPGDLAAFYRNELIGSRQIGAQEPAHHTAGVDVDHYGPALLSDAHRLIHRLVSHHDQSIASVIVHPPVTFAVLGLHVDLVVVGRASQAQFRVYSGMDDGCSTAIAPLNRVDCGCQPTNCAGSATMFLQEPAGPPFSLGKFLERESRLEAELCREQPEVVVATYRNDLAAALLEGVEFAYQQVWCGPLREEVSGEDDTTDALAFEEVLGQLREFDTASMYVSNDGGLQAHDGIFGQTPQLGSLDLVFLWLVCDLSVADSTRMGLVGSRYDHTSALFIAGQSDCRW